MSDDEKMMISSVIWGFVCSKHPLDSTKISLIVKTLCKMKDIVNMYYCSAIINDRNCLSVSDNNLLVKTMIEIGSSADIKLFLISSKNLNSNNRNSLIKAMYEKEIIETDFSYYDSEKSLNIVAKKK